MHPASFHHRNPPEKSSQIRSGSLSVPQKNSRPVTAVSLVFQHNSFRMFCCHFQNTRTTLIFGTIVICENSKVCLQTGQLLIPSLKNLTDDGLLIVDRNNHCKFLVIHPLASFTDPGFKILQRVQDRIIHIPVPITAQSTAEYYISPFFCKNFILLQKSLVANSTDRIKCLPAPLPHRRILSADHALQ